MSPTKFHYSTIVVVLLVFLFLVTAFDHGTILFWDWSGRRSFPFFIVAFSVSAPIFFSSVLAKLLPKGLESRYPFNVNKYHRTGLLDALFDHYTNVATIGLFFTAYIYFFSRLIEKYDYSILSIIASASYILLLICYVPLALRFMVYTLKYCKNDFNRVLLTGLVLLIDNLLIGMFIDVAPTIFK